MTHNESSSPPPGVAPTGALHQAAEVLRQYANIIRECKLDELERFHYGPEVDEAAEAVERAIVLFNRVLDGPTPFDEISAFVEGRAAAAPTVAPAADLQAIAWAYRKLCAFGVHNGTMDSAMMMDRIKVMLLADSQETRRPSGSESASGGAGETKGP